jgi:multisubunit Na+/H+ antiporter MnhE subunit
MSLALRVASLTLIYALALASFAPLDLATGVVLSTACLIAVRGLRGTGNTPARELVKQVAGFPLLFAAVTVQVVRGTWSLSLMILGLRTVRHAGLVEVPLGSRSESGMAAAAVLTTLAPGDVVIDVDVEREIMLIHTVDASDPDAVRERFRHQRERYGQRVFP